jgi:hypothetical protein
MAGDVTGSHEEEPMFRNVLRSTVIAAVVGGAALTLSACGGAPATTITKDGTYTVGSDIIAGTLAKETISGAAQCELTLKTPEGITLAVSQAAGRDDPTAHTVALKAVPLKDGQTVQVKNCGTLVIQS